MRNKKLPATIEDRLEEYKVIYPDTTVTSVCCSDDESISRKDGLELSKMVCQMTHSGLLEFSIFGGQMYIYKSREFLKVADGFKKGARVRFHDPRTPAVCHESVMMADGMQYNCGIPFIWTEDSELDSGNNSDTFAVYWRPVEEDGK